MINEVSKNGETISFLHIAKTLSQVNQHSSHSNAEKAYISIDGQSKAITTLYGKNGKTYTNTTIENLSQIILEITETAETDGTIKVDPKELTGMAATLEILKGRIESHQNQKIYKLKKWVYNFFGLQEKKEKAFFQISKTISIVKNQILSQDIYRLNGEISTLNHEIEVLHQLKAFGFEKNHEISNNLEKSIVLLKIKLKEHLRGSIEEPQEVTELSLHNILDYIKKSSSEDNVKLVTSTFVDLKSKEMALFWYQAFVLSPNPEETLLKLIQNKTEKLETKQMEMDEKIKSRNHVKTHFTQK